MMFDQDVKACWSFCFELKMLNELKYTTSWVRCALGNVCICVCIWKQCRELRLMIALPGSVERSWSSTADWSFPSIALYTVLHFFFNCTLHSSVFLYCSYHFQMYSSQFYNSFQLHSLVITSSTLKCTFHCSALLQCKRSLQWSMQCVDCKTN